MDINQFAVYQLKNGPETRQMRFRSYEKLQQSGIQVRYEYYREVYLGKMQRQDTPENIRERLQKKIPKSFDGHSLSVSDGHPDYRRQGIFSYGTYGIRQECCLCDTGCRRENCGGG